MKYDRKRYVMWLAVAAVSSLPFFSFAQDQETGAPDRKTELPAEVSEATNRGVVALGELISDEIFDTLDEIDAYSVDLSDSGRAEVKIGRKVINNNDIEESYTVVDRVQIPITLPGWSVPLGSEHLSFHLGTSGGIDFRNIRVVKPQANVYRESGLELLLGAEDLKERKRQLVSMNLVEQLKEMFSSADVMALAQSKEKDEKGEDKVLLMDALRKARYGQLWNMVSGPLRLPLRANWLSHLDMNEVTTWGGTGVVEIGVGASITPDFASTGLTGSIASAGVRAYLTGNFQIAVKRSAQDKVKVKVLRSTGRGFGGSLGANGSLNIYDGYLFTGSIFGLDVSTTIGQISESLVPFQFSANRSWGDSFEMGYEYDLRDERAIEAYEQAVLGRFGLSSEIAAEGKDAPVSELFRKDAQVNGKSQGVTINLMLYERNGTASYSVENATIRFPDGVSHVVKASTDVSFKHETDLWILKTKEQVRYQVRTDFIDHEVDKDSKRKADSLVGLIGEGTIEDNYTAGAELNRYSTMFGRLFGIDNMFPRVPEFIKTVEKVVTVNTGYAEGQIPGYKAKSVESVEVSRRTLYGRSQYHFRFGVSEQQLVKIAQVPQEEMWPHLEAGFGVKHGLWSRGKAGLMVPALLGWVGDLGGWFADFNDIEKPFGVQYYHARAFREKWKELQKYIVSMKRDDGSVVLDRTVRQEMGRRVGLMFSDKTFTFELMSAAMHALRTSGEKDISYQIVVRTSAFPSLNVKGGDLTEIEKVTQRYSKETNFEDPNLQQDLSLEVSGLNVKQIGAMEFKVDYKISRVPTKVLFRLDEVSALLRTQRTLILMTVENTGNFVAGDNTFTIKKSTVSSIESELASAMKPGKNYRLTIGLLDDKGSGPPQTTDFFANKHESGQRGNAERRR